MRKRLISALFIILFSLPFSCSELVLPKNIDINATMELPIRVVADNWGNSFAKAMKKSFTRTLDRPDMNDLYAEVYDVNYGQSGQTFLISIQTEIANNLNPAVYLEGAGRLLYGTGTTDPFNISYELDLEFLKEQQLSASEIISVSSIPDGTLLPPITYSFSGNMPLGIDGFLHASIAKGDMEIIIDLLDGNTVLTNSMVDITYSNISINQDKISYDGLTYSGSSNKFSLDGRDINNETIKIGGTAYIKSKSGGSIVLSSGGLNLNITIKMNMQKLKEVDWNFSRIADQLNNQQIKPVSLDDVSPYVNYMLYDEKSVGLLFEFEEIIDGLAMSVKSNALGIMPDFQELKKGGEIIYANENAGTLWLGGSTPNIINYPLFIAQSMPTGEFDFKLELSPKGGGNVLHIEPAEGITPDVMKINGKAEFFQNWKEAQLNLDKIINASPNAPGTYMKTIPSEDAPIDFSLLSSYMSGFIFDGIQSEIHLNGPNGVIDNMDIEPSLSLWAEYWQDNSTRETVSIYDDEKLTLEEKPVSLDARDFDANGSYKKNTLPPNGKPFEFSKIMNAQPKNLIFNYVLKLPPTLTVTHDIFEKENDSADHKIIATILILFPLNLMVADNGPGIIRFPDMFADKKDLFGRNNIEEDSIFTSLNMDYLKLVVGLTGSFFNGGKLFIEEEGKELLFRNGIVLNGNKIAINITDADFTIIKNNLISPDFRLIFERPGFMLKVPRNIRLTNIKFEARDKIEF
jgi:hypothetical protein